MFTDLSVGPMKTWAEKAAKVFDRSFEVLQEYADAFSLISKLPSLIKSLESHDDLRIMRIPTELKTGSASTTIRQIKKELSPSEARMFVNVNVLNRVNDVSESYEIEGIQFTVEQRGYWKKLNPDQMGKGKNGEEIQGRTWVTVKESWEESFGRTPPENSTNFTIRPTSSEAGSGEIYVMRSALHPHDYYKIGYTEKSSVDRAKQLHRTSGQPDQFNLVQKWKIKAAHIIEQSVHTKLKRYRVNMNREFFNIPLEKIRETIEETIREHDAGL